jgi:uncharacterized phage protein gp47/JayE
MNAVVAALLTFSSLVENSAAAVQGACGQLLNLTVGSVLRAILEANASIALWIQWLIVQVLALTRAATSTGPDLDSWMADYSFVRLAAVAATGSVTFSRYSPNTTALIVPYFNADGSINTSGAQVETADGTQIFGVTIDTTNSLWNSSMNGYLVPINTVSATVPVQDLVGGSAGNVQIGTISLIASAIPGIDTVTNSAAFTNGVDAESDSAFRARFVLYIQGLSKATPLAVDSAVADVQQGLTYNILVNQNADGDYQPGNFVVVVNDGTGSPSDSLLDNVSAAVNLVAPLGSTFSVQGPVLTTVNVSLILTVASGYNINNIEGPVQTAIQAYISALGIGESLPYTRVAQIAYDAAAGITNVTGLTLNGGTSDITVPANGAIVPGTISVT